MAKRRYLVAVELTRTAREAVDRTSDDTGLPRTVLVERIMSWFVRQDRSVQALVLGHLPPEVVAKAAALLVAAAAKASTGTVSDKP